MLELNHQFRIVDLHAHLTGPGADVPGPAVSAEDAEREMHQAGIVRAAVAPAPGIDDGDGYVPGNNAVARQAVERPMVAFARITGPGRRPTDRVRRLSGWRADHHTSPDDIEQYAYNDRFHGFALDPRADGVPDTGVLEAMDDVGLPLVVHGGTAFPPEEVASTLLDYSFPVVLGHFGGYPLDRELMQTAVDLLEDYDQLYLDTAAVRFRTELERAIREHPARVVFGSGFPAVHPSVAVMEVLTLDLPEDAMTRTFSSNAERLVDALTPQ
ncbi:MAG: amidohydrolase family protein [Halobacteriaceae archaeon]